MASHREVFSRTEQGYAVTGLRTAAAELAMVPALGGRVISLRSRRTGREWCWHQPRPDWLWANQPGDSFGLSRIDAGEGGAACPQDARPAAKVLQRVGDNAFHLVC